MTPDMQARNFADGTRYCATHGKDHAFPDRMDVCVCCFPCGPWSLKGNRLGFRASAGSVVWQALKTVQALKPAIFFMENVTAIDSSTSSSVAESDLVAICSKMQSELPGNRMMCMKHIEPTKNWIPNSQR